MTLDGKDPDEARELVHTRDKPRASIFGSGPDIEPDTRFDWDLEDEYQRLARNGLFISIPRTPRDRN